jgi:DNA replication protein DnaC
MPVSRSVTASCTGLELRPLPSTGITRLPRYYGPLRHLARPGLALAGRQLERFHQQLERHDLLVLDELGYVPCTKAGAELLFEVVSRAYERTSLLVTTNLPFESWTEVLGTERLTGALLDRLTHRIHILEANGESYRLRESRRRLRQRPAARTNETET